jgi:predicted hydrocarbon binding protein
VRIDAEKVEKHKRKQFNHLRENADFSGDENGDIELEPQRYNIMGSDYFMCEMLEMLQDIYGQGAGGIIRESGLSYGEDLKESLEFEENSDQDLGKFLGFLKFLGYSDLRVDGEKIVVASSPTAEEHRKTDHKPKKTCYFLEGVLTSAIRLTEEEVQFRETECKAEGAEKCVFKPQ